METGTWEACEFVWRCPKCRCNHYTHDTYDKEITCCGVTYLVTRNKPKVKAEVAWVPHTKSDREYDIRDPALWWKDDDHNDGFESQTSWD